MLNKIPAKLNAPLQKINNPEKVSLWSSGASVKNISGKNKNKP